MTLSVLICTIPERFDTYRTIYEKVLAQAEGKDVEVIGLMDNRKRTIGEKRGAALGVAIGKYFTFLDDDDDCSDDYVDELLKAAESGADIISFDQKAIIRTSTWGGESTVNFSLKNDNEEFQVDGTTKRKPYTPCAFKTEKFGHLSYGVTSYGEDTIFCEQAWAMAESEYHINKILHIYTHDENITAASL